MSTITLCGGYLDLQTPVRSERVRDFQPPWRTVFIYKCKKCGNETRMRANSFIGRRPVPSTGAVICSHPI